MTNLTPPFTYTAYKVCLDGSLTDRANLGGIDELNTWMEQKHGVHATVQVTQDQTGKVKLMTDNGESWTYVS